MCLWTDEGFPGRMSSGLRIKLSVWALVLCGDLTVGVDLQVAELSIIIGVPLAALLQELDHNASNDGPTLFHLRDCGIGALGYTATSQL